VKETGSRITQKTASDKSSYTILYIEDDEANRQLVQFIFDKRSDLQLSEAVNGNDGFTMAKSNPPHLILLDLSLPDIDGYEVLKKLQDNETTSNIPIIALSGNSTPNDIDKGLAAGFNGYLTKPIDITKLNSTIDSSLGINA
jgi:CheY-like chemotaxis protein